MSKLIICLLLLFNICICEETVKTRVFTQEDAQSQLSVRNGEEFTIKLKSNASTGFVWKFLNEAEVKKGIQLVKKSFERPSSSDSKPLIGAPGYTLFHFKAVRSSNGPVPLKFSYARNTNANTLTTFKILVK